MDGDGKAVVRYDLPFLNGKEKIKKENWKPVPGDDIYVIEHEFAECRTWTDRVENHALWKLGWVFETEEEAEANCSRITNEIKKLKQKR